LWSGPNGFQASVTSTAIIPNVQLNDAGLYTVLLESDYGCTSLDSFNLNVFPSTTIQVTKEYNVCEGQTIQFDATGGNTFNWTPVTGLSNPSIPNPRLTPRDSIVYMVLTTNNYGCRDSAYVSVNIFRKPIANAGPDINIISGDTASLKAFVSGTGIQFNWSPVQFMSDPLSISPLVSPPDVIQYTLTARSTVGCPGAEDQVTVKVFDDLYIPNAFTPNGDRINDVFRVLPIEGYTLSRLSIYNRWGEKIFNTTNPSIGWDGRIREKLQSPGIYIYYLDWKSPVGKSLVKKGTLQLIR
jgi:gliding motility-associated-like protein